MTAGGSIEKAFAVLEALAEHENIAGLAAATGLPKSTVHRILQTLISQGFAAVDTNSAYLPGSRILAIAGKVMHRLDPARHAQPALRRLRDRSGYTVHFAIRDADEAIYVEKLPGPGPYQMASHIGQSLHLHSTAIGKAILASLPGDEVRAICERTGLVRMTANTITTLPALRRDLKAVQKRQYAIDDEENESGVRCVGAAVTGHLGQIVGAVSISTLMHELPDPRVQAVGSEVVSTAREVTLALGGAR